MEILGVSLAVMCLISVAIFQLAIEGGINVVIEGGHAKIFKGEEYETIIKIESRASDWICSMPPTVKIATVRLLKTEPMEGGKMRLTFVGTYAGRSEDVEVGISLTDPLRLMRRLEQVAHGDFVLDTLPVSILAKPVPRRLTVYGFGDQPTGYPGPGHELYGVDEYRSGDTKDIIWKRVARSPDETLTARVREANVREVVKVGVVRFAERGEGRAAWTDLLCEALGYVGKDVLEMGAAFTIVYRSPQVERPGSWTGEEEGPADLVQARATDVVGLAEAVMSCSVAAGSRDVAHVVANSDFVVTGLKELEDDRMARLVSQRPMLIISEEASPGTAFPERSVVYSGSENLYPLVRKILER